MSAAGTQAPAAGRRRRIAVIGAGPVGLVAVKELKEKGYDVTGFEKRPAAGGVFTDTYSNLQLTSSSLLTSYGSFMGGEVERPVLWRCGEYLSYLAEYAERFDLLRHYRFGTSVRSVRRAPEGGWRVRAQADGAAEDEAAFDNVVICCGSNMRPRFPAWADPRGFDGAIIHSGTVRDGAEFAGKRVLVVGVGESGSDIALMAARAAEESAISTRNGPGYVIPRYYRGMPSDLDTNRCYHSLPRSVVGKPFVRFKVRIEDALQNDGADQAVLRKAAEINRARGVSPFHRFGTKSTAFIEAMVYHGASYRPEVTELRRDGVVFADGTEFRCDVIVCCTGFAPEFAFLEEHEPSLARYAANARALYKRMLAPEAGTDIAWIGYVRPGVGSVPPCAEMQARHLAQLLSGERSLPPRDEMLRDIQMQAELDLKQFAGDAERVATLTDYFRFMETMGEAIGCRPSLPRLMVREPRVALKVLLGPLCAAQYRLQGPGADPEGARAALLRAPMMPWPVLAYEMMLLFTCWAAGLNREPWRPRGRLARQGGAEGARPLRNSAARVWLRIRSTLSGAGG
ncbi:MAG: hypothetical protein AVDCRST_MAG68-3301 [uncultured Gemmatimonadetes bacterium]|uniref:Flavin-containing monooxygenase n=1 Tax=uncultured Gemmatimonadota bacterium TaxID=203437 RepID=A0A6J4M0C6_9BACT|nr:MAG: hypothetical protein AVDCRST_MAG68-3301 [uncultured Gemmatimonadota bacterium]